MRVSVIQMQVQMENKSANLAHAKDLIERSCLDTPDIILLPETFNVGFFPAEPAPLADAMEQGESWTLLSNLAKKRKVNIVGGSVARLGPEGQVFNTMYIFDRQGQEVATYDKIHLFSPSGEKEVFEAGNKPCCFELDNKPMASIICYDLRFTELIRGLALSGAQVLFVPAQWPHPRSEHWRTLLRARAIENQMFVVAANDCGPMGKVVNCGYSAIIDPWGQVLAEAGEEEIILNVDLDLSQVQAVRQRIAVYNDRRPEIYKELLK
jgi:omega-amidase